MARRRSRILHWASTWLRWFAYLIDDCNQTLGGCGCGWTERPWPLPPAIHPPLCLTHYRASEHSLQGQIRKRQAARAKEPAS